ncbi:MAG: hypothetical protein II456_04395, partial [Firmicutes bacterium]|nr:hypothetical protein [Bacillota bacterium]
MGYTRTNKPDGTVEIQYDNGSRYAGEMIGGQLTGKGTMHYADGRVYEGYFVNGEWHGFGKASFPSNHSTYEGEWSHNLREGKGTTIYYNDDNTVNATYIAEYHNDRIDGHCRTEFGNSDVMEGMFRGYDPLGPVKYWYGLKRENQSLAGWFYEGDMPIIDNFYSRHGHGRLTSPDGVVY